MKNSPLAAWLGEGAHTKKPGRVLWGDGAVLSAGCRVGCMCVLEHRTVHHEEETLSFIVSFFLSRIGLVPSLGDGYLCQLAAL